MKNREIREAIFKSGIKQWQVAEKLGIHEVTFIRKLRQELQPSEREKVLAIVAQLAGKGEK